MIFKLGLQHGQKRGAGDFQPNAHTEKRLEAPLAGGRRRVVGELGEEARREGGEDAGGDEHGKGVVAAQGEGAAEGAPGRAAGHGGEEQGAGLDGTVEVDDLGPERDVDDDEK